MFVMKKKACVIINDLHFLYDDMENELSFSIMRMDQYIRFFLYFNYVKLLKLPFLFLYSAYLTGHRRLWSRKSYFVSKNCFTSDFLSIRLGIE